MLVEHNRTPSINSNLMSLPSMNQVGAEETLANQIEAAMKDYEILQNKLSNIKRHSYARSINPLIQSPILSKPQTPAQMKLLNESGVKTPSHSRVLFTPSTINVMNEFKSVLKESEQAIGNNKNPNRSIISHNHNPASFHKTITPLPIQNDPFNPQCEFLRISNQVLNKSNLDLKNLNRVLEIELKSYKTNNASNVPLSQYDDNVNIFIESLKTSLNTSQMSNRELNDILTFLKDNNNKLLNENEQIKTQISKFQKENETTFSKNKEVLSQNTDIITKCNELDEQNKSIQKEINTFEQELAEQKVKNNHLEKVNQSFSNLQFNNEEVLNQLKVTIENLRKQNDESVKEKEQNTKQLAYINKELKSKEDEIGDMKAKVNDVLNRQNDLKELDKTYLNRVNITNNEIFNYEMTLKNMVNDAEKALSNQRTLNQFIEDREKTIENLSETLGFLTANIVPMNGNNKTNQQSSSNELKRIELARLKEEYLDKESQLNEIKMNYEAILKLKDEKISLLSLKIK